MDTYIGFDSAWTDNPKAPGAICTVHIEDGTAVDFSPPRLVSFDQALAEIKANRSDDGVTLVALDQPTVVANLTGMRPVERVAASLVSWLGGGVQPSNQGRAGMFCQASPVWRFLAGLGAVEDPELARAASDGLFLMEVFPALALASMNADFFGRLRAPRYNPGRRATFRLADWHAVAVSATRELDGFGCVGLSDWCSEASRIAQPRKSDQDRLDSVLCVLIALKWRLRPRADSMLLGDFVNGYMVLPASADARGRLVLAARKYGVPVDGDRVV